MGVKTEREKEEGENTEQPAVFFRLLLPRFPMFLLMTMTKVSILPFSSDTSSLIPSSAPYVVVHFAHDVGTSSLLIFSGSNTGPFSHVNDEDSLFLLPFLPRSEELRPMTSIGLSEASNTRAPS